MTSINSFFKESDFDAKKEKFYQVSVIDFFGIEHQIDVFAYSAEEAQESAAEQVENADYTYILYSESI